MISFVAYTKESLLLEYRNPVNSLKTLNWLL